MKPINKIMFYSKTKRFCILVLPIFLAAMTSCQPPVVFGRPQPEGFGAITQIPHSYRGIYWCPVDSASLFVDEQAFIKRKELHVKLTKKEIAENPDMELVNGHLSINDWDSSFPVTESGDSITTQIIFRDTIFALSGPHMAKLFRGHLILNTKLDQDTWAVSVASKKGADVLTIAKADLPENLAELDSITPVKSLMVLEGKRTQLHLTPTRAAFEKIIERGILFETSCTQYERVLPLKDYAY